VVVMAMAWLCSAAHAYVGDYESTYWRAWLKIGQARYSDAAKSARVSLLHMGKRYGIVRDQVALFRERADSADPQLRAQIQMELAFLAKRLAWMDTRKADNEWIISEASRDGAGALPAIASDVAVTLELAHQAVVRQFRAARLEQLQGNFDAADAQHQEALELWDKAALETAARLQSVETAVAGHQPSAEEQARLTYLREWSRRYADTASGLRAEYEAMRDPQRLVNRGLFYRQRAELYADGQFRTTYRDRATFFFSKARWRCQRIIDDRHAPEYTVRLERLLGTEDPDVPGEPQPAQFYDAVMEEWKMYTYFSEYWREDATNINIE